MGECAEYIKEAMKDVTDDSEFKNSVVHCLEFMAQAIDSKNTEPEHHVGDYKA